MLLDINISENNVIIVAAVLFILCCLVWLFRGGLPFGR